jgi:DNA-directed RNA polymerase specialized sigma24 family protein
VLEQYIQGASTQEIASRLAMSEELVRQHKSRGLRSLRQIRTTGSLSPKHTRVEV